MNEPKTIREVARDAAEELSLVPVIVRPVSIATIPLLPVVYAVCGIGILAGAIGYGIKIVATRITS